MAINIFEGARRITLLTAAVIGIAGTAFTWTHDPYVSVKYAVSHPGTKPTRVDSCFDEDAREYVTVKTSDGNNVSAHICFIAHLSNDNRMLIPYQTTADGKWWMNEKYSADVTKYTKGVARIFRVEQSEQAEVDSLWMRERIQDLMQGFGITAGLIFFLFISSRIIGWIVRGFLGIPPKQDVRPAS